MAPQTQSGTAEKPYEAPEPPKPLLAKEAKRRNLVDPSKNYRMTIQLGTRRRWRNWCPGKFEKVEQTYDSRNREPSMKFEYVPAIHDVGTVLGSTANGLITAHNAWVEANESKGTADGTLNRQLLVLSCTVSTEQPVDKPITLQMTPETIALISAESAKVVAREIMDAMLKQQGSK
jgi:hypothetical protein